MFCVLLFTIFAWISISGGVIEKVKATNGLELILKQISNTALFQQKTNNSQNNSRIMKRDVTTESSDESTTVLEWTVFDIEGPLNETIDDIKKLFDALKNKSSSYRRESEEESISISISESESTEYC